MELPFFGEIDLNSLEELYEVDFKLEGQNKNCTLEIWFDDEEISKEKMLPVLNLLQSIPDFVKSAKEFLFEKEKGRNILLKYLNHQTEVLSQVEKERFGILDSDHLEVEIHKLENQMYLKSISIWPENNEILRLDYTIGHQVTDYIICLDFNTEKVIVSIAIES